LQQARTGERDGATLCIADLSGSRWLLSAKESRDRNGEAWEEWIVYTVVGLDLANRIDGIDHDGARARIHNPNGL
jgi:hypothetical protein